MANSNTNNDFRTEPPFETFEDRENAIIYHACRIGPIDRSEEAINASLQAGVAYIKAKEALIEVLNVHPVAQPELTVNIYFHKGKHENLPFRELYKGCKWEFADQEIVMEAQRGIFIATDDPYLCTTSVPPVLGVAADRFKPAEGETV